MMKLLRNNKGISLVETLLAGALMTALGLVLMTLANVQNRQARMVQEKLNVLEAESLLQRTLAVDSFCGCWLQGRQLNTNAPISWNSFPTFIPMSYNATCGPNPGGNILSLGGQIGMPSVRVFALQMVDIYQVAPNSGTYRGTLRVQFDPSRLIKPIQDIEVPITFVVDTTDPANARDVVTCGEPTKQLGRFRRTGSGACRIANPFTGDCSCPAGAVERYMGNNDTHGWGGWIAEFLCI